MYTESDLLAKSDQVDGLKEAWERLGRSDAAWKTRVLGSFNAARITHDDQQEYQRIEGLAQNHAEDFLDEDIEANNKLTFASKKHFLAEKKQLRKGDQNPETNRAIGWMRNYPGLSDIMTEQGIHDRTKQNTDAYDTFTGAVHEALASWTKAHKGLTPTQEQVLKEIGPMVLRNRLTTPGWIFGAQKEPFVSWGPFTDPISASLNWMFGPTASNVMNQVIPSDKRDQVKEEFTKEHGYEPSDKEIWRTHVRNQFDELYGAPKEGPRVVKTVKVGKEGAPK
jgi:hypothetical protein